ncbi:hypothetical protein SO802_025025 [Lithocarpus litseifolius]|uniref:Uncharacterized protein n=1 Tax=Lithocarpus litseifolius TaxID=425828 RepID=A0AAW2BYU8_9ROSI
MIWLLAGILVYEAIARIINDTGEVQGFLMFVVSAFGLVVNSAMALLLGHDHGHGHGDHGHSHGGHDELHSHGLIVITHHRHHHDNHHDEGDSEHHDHHDEGHSMNT